MRVVVIAEGRLYRIYNNGKCKDVWVSNGEIKYPENPYNVLTPTEQREIEMLIF